MASTPIKRLADAGRRGHGQRPFEVFCARFVHKSTAQDAVREFPGTIFTLLLHWSSYIVKDAVRILRAAWTSGILRQISHTDSVLYYLYCTCICCWQVRGKWQHDMKTTVRLCKSLSVCASPQSCLPAQCGGEDLHSPGAVGNVESSPGRKRVKWGVSIWSSGKKDPSPTGMYNMIDNMASSALRVRTSPLVCQEDHRLRWPSAGAYRTCRSRSRISISSTF